MSSSSALPSQETFRKLLKKINSNQFLNRELINICRINALNINGVKATLQKTISEALTDAYTKQDIAQYRHLEESIRREKKDGIASVQHQAHTRNPAASPSSQVRANLHVAPFGDVAPVYGNTPTPSAQLGYGSTYGSNMNGSVSGHRAFPAAPPGPQFHSSPFHQVLQRIGDVRLCQAMSQHRNSISIYIKALDTPQLRACVDDKSLRVMVFCAAVEHGYQDIAFPHQSEMKVNGEEVKANLRGLKNKPGSTRPVDITDLMRLRIPAYSNSIEFTYALTKNKFWIVVNLCKQIPVEELVRDVSKKKITKASVISELTEKAQDPDIELASQVMSLKCPISYMRLVTPVRASTCTHVQCFDATSYLQLQQQGPQWVCPVCSKSAPFERLAIDEYVRDILAMTAKSVDQVDIQPDGTWQAHGSAEKQQVRPEPQYENVLNVDDDDDELDSSDVSYSGGPSTITPTGYGSSRASIPLPTPTMLGHPTPSSGVSREGSSIPRSGGATKRTHEVIDLTLDSDEDDDDEPLQPPPKRHQFNRPGAGHPEFY